MISTSFWSAVHQRQEWRTSQTS